MLLLFALACAAASWLLTARMLAHTQWGRGALLSSLPSTPLSSARLNRVDLPALVMSPLAEQQMESAGVMVGSAALGAQITSWYATAGEVFPEGALDAQLQQEERDLRRQTEPLAASDIGKITIRGRIPEILGLDDVVLRPPEGGAAAGTRLIGGKAYFTSGEGHGEVYHLGRSKQPGDPFWYLSKGGPVRASSDPKPQVPILAYAGTLQKKETDQLGENAKADAAAADLEPWQPGSATQWWAKPHGHWQKFAPEEFYLMPSKTRKISTTSKTFT